MPKSKLEKQRRVEQPNSRSLRFGIIARKSVALTLSAILATQPLMLKAQEIRADQAAGDRKSVV